MGETTEEPTVPEETEAMPHKDQLSQTIERSKKAITSLIDTAVAHGIDRSAFDHVIEVWDEDNFVILPGSTLKHTRARAFVNRDAKQIFIEEGDVGSLPVVLHEQAHLALFLKADEHKKMEGEIARLFGLKLKPDKTLDTGGTYIETLSHEEQEEAIASEIHLIRQTGAKLLEGLADWVVKQQGGDITYPEQVDGVEELGNILQKKEGMSKDQANAQIIRLAFTGDLGYFMQHMSTLNILETLEDVPPVWTNEFDFMPSDEF